MSVYVNICQYLSIYVNINISQEGRGGVGREEGKKMSLIYLLVFIYLFISLLVYFF